MDAFGHKALTGTARYLANVVARNLDTKTDVYKRQGDGCLHRHGGGAARREHGRRTAGRPAPGGGREPVAGDLHQRGQPLSLIHISILQALAQAPQETHLWVSTRIWNSETLFSSA